MSEEQNPFSGLMGAKTEQPASPNNLLENKVSALIENVFLFTINKTPQKNKQLVYLEDIAQSAGTHLLNLDLLEQALFERILMPSPADFLIPNDCRTYDGDLAAEVDVITYLYTAFQRNQNFRNANDCVNVQTCDRITQLILRNVGTAVKQPDLYENQDIPQQWFNILKQLDDSDICCDFLSKTVREVMQDDADEGTRSLRSIFYPVFDTITKCVKEASLITLEVWVRPALMPFVSDKTNPDLAQLLMSYSTPPDGSSGAKYAETLLGQLLCLSIMPKTSTGKCEYFDNPAEAMQSNVAASLWNYLKMHWEALHSLFKGFLLIGGNVRSSLLKWIGDCLQANAARGQIWSAHQMAAVEDDKTASDAFMIGLCAVMLRLCQPLFKPQFKVLLVDPTYCAVKDADREAKGVHMQGIDKETCLRPTDEGEVRQTAEKYNFITECFFMTHKAIDLGYRVCIDKYIRKNRDLHRLQTAQQDAAAQNGDMAQYLMQMVLKQSQSFLCLQTLITEPGNDSLQLQFYDATATWLAQVTARETHDDAAKGYAPQTIQRINLPLSNGTSKVLQSIPEFLIENIVGFMSFNKRAEGQTDAEAQNSFFTMILIFMGSSERARNPHLRARLAEGLENLLPASSTTGFSSSFSASLFTSHPFRFEIVPNLLRVFVEIEMTGQSVQFEQKFNYRRPMYIVMEYLWNIKEQRECFKKLALDAERDIEAVDPPLFLRFINLLINDAIFLLDESLSNLQQIRTLQHAEDAGEWASLPQRELQQHQSNLQNLGMMARFDNILGRDTINIIKLLTSEVQGIFCHASMVDRVAAMLNYFLLHLVGPKKGNFKVKDKKELEFDPATTVLEICRIYINLQESEAFCLAISQDGRSYSPQLFEYAEQVLIRIGGGQLIGEIGEFSQKVSRLEKQQKEDQEALTDIPDEFLDPIMSSLMVDPVILPSSKVTVDRTTIARHLLSDQSDPFNREPLTMDQIIPNEELLQQIQAWIKQKRDAYAGAN